jgi:2'-5' RNA ligase
MNGPRFAIYFTPAPGSRLARFGSAAVGYDCDRAVDVPLLAIPGLDPQAQALAATAPARYGFHATLVAPFHLDADTAETALAAHVASFAAGRAPVPLGRLITGLIGGFVVLVRVGSQDDLMALATDCVSAFGEHRAPLSAVERERRLAARLTPRQVELLDRWGYPYVLDEFRFHMTLAGPLAADQRQRWCSALGDAFAAQADEETIIDAISLMRQDDRNARFRMVLRAPLKG